MNQTPLRISHNTDIGRNKLIAGMEELHDAVASTLGAAGKTVILEDVLGNPKITKDGVTVAEYINPVDSVSNLGASLLRDASKKTADEAGDGTTTSTVLAMAILNEAIPQVNNSNFRQIIAGIKKGRDKVLAELKTIKTPVTEDNLVDIATISANGDRELGSLIKDAYDKVGIEGTVVVSDSSTDQTYVHLADGSSIEKGYSSPRFINDKKGRCILDKPDVLLLDQKVDNIWKLQGILERCLSEQKPLLIIGELEKQALSTLIMNKLQNNMKVVVIEPPLFGAQRQAVLNDLAVATGANVIGEDYGNAVDMATYADLGTIDKVTIDNQRTIFKFNKGHDTTELVNGIKEELTDATGATRGVLKFRLNLLTGKLAEVRVGAVTSTEQEEVKDRVDDAVHAARCAMLEGVVPGGGVTMRDLANRLLDDLAEGEHLTEGGQILANALKKPEQRILNNAGISECKGKNAEGEGTNALTHEIVDMKEAGIIDPAKVTKHAIINAVAVATTVLSTDYIVTNLRQGENESIK